MKKILIIIVVMLVASCGVYRPQTTSEFYWRSFGFEYGNLHLPTVYTMHRIIMSKDSIIAVNALNDTIRIQGDVRVYPDSVVWVDAEGRKTIYNAY